MVLAKLLTRQGRDKYLVAQTARYFFMNEVIEQPTAEYSASIFNIGSMAEAKDIILTAEDDLTTTERWETETPYLVDLISQKVKITEDTVVLDYGCGIGRMAKALIDKFNCRVIGMDLISNMRSLGNYYVSSDRYMAIHPNMFELLKPEVDLALGIWVFQHCYDPKEDLAVVQHMMKPGAKLFVTNNILRSVPTKNAGFVNDGIDIRELLATGFKEEQVDKLDQKIVSNAVSRATYYGWYEKKYTAPAF